jgi:hypothetical protein
MTVLYRVALALFAGLLLFVAPAAPARAQDPVLEELGGAQSLPRSFEVDKPYTISLRYTDPKGDQVRAKNAVMQDQGPSGLTNIPAKAVTGDPTTGAIITWEVNKLAPGAHSARFSVKNESNVTTYYPKDDGVKYEFAVESLTTKIIIFVVILLVALLALPLIIYLIARAINPRGDPSKAARMGLLLGVVSSLAAFVLMFFSALFVGPYAWLGYAIMGVLLLAAVVILIRR